MNKISKVSHVKFSFVKPLIISDFAKKVSTDAGAIIKYFFIKGKFTNLNTVLSKEDCIELCKEFKFNFEEKEASTHASNPFIEYLDFDSAKNVITKTPVVTIMGHVDHGKTTLLDRIRGTNVTDSEFGGITQHIGAYQVVKDGKKITFLDTPGHQAFTKMRARGATVTDIVVLVVAADDGIKPQTIEAIQHALAAKVKLIVFVNKIDKGVKNIDFLKNELMKHDVIVEDFGGDVILLTGSALQGKGIDELLENISLVSEVAELKTTMDAPAVGAVIESKLEKGMGATATVILSRGTLKPGDFIVMKSTICKIRSMTGSSGESIKLLEPAFPAKISGFKDLPEAGDRFISFPSEKEAKVFADSFMEDTKDTVFLEKNKDAENLNIIVRADVSGSLEAIKEIVYSSGIPIVASSIGSITEADLQLASISNAFIFNFNQKIPQPILNRAQEMKVPIRNYRSVYEIEEALQELLLNNRFTEEVDVSLGKAHVVKLWYHSKVGTIAGCKVIEGKISKTDKVKVLRGDLTLVRSTIKSFKTEDFEIKECSQNQECGIVVNNWNDIKEGDIIEAFKVVVKEV